jgi:hypothetical protein
MITVNNITSRWSKDSTDNLNADIEKDVSIRIYGTYSGRDFDKTFKIGDVVEYDSYNLYYTNPIQAIKNTYVEVKGHYDRNVRMKLYDFIWRNYKLDLEKIAKENFETSMYI